MYNFSKGLILSSSGNETIRFREEEFYRNINDKLIKIPNKNNAKIPIIFIWRLFRFPSKKNDFELGQYIRPINDIGNGLNSEWIALNLNEENCFDFNYTPNEGDNLFIQTNQIDSPYISFIFKKGNWVYDHYCPFIWDIQHIMDGIIKEVE